MVHILYANAFLFLLMVNCLIHFFVRTGLDRVIAYHFFYCYIFIRFKYFSFRTLRRVKASPALASAFKFDEKLLDYLKLYIFMYADDTIVLAESEDEMQKALKAHSQVP